MRSWGSLEDKLIKGLGAISNTFEDSISFFDFETYNIINKVYLKSLDDNQLKSTFFFKKGIIGPFKMTYDSPRELLYCVNKFDNSMAMVDIRELKSVKTVSCGTYPMGIAIDSKSAYIANGDSDTISIVDLEGKELVSQIKVGEMPIDLHYCEKEKHLITALYKGNSIALVDVDSLEVEKLALKDISPFGILVTEEKYIIYGFNNFDQKGSIEIRNREDLKIIHSLSTPSMPLGVCWCNNTLFASDGENGKLIKINLDKGQVQNINLGGMPQCICYGSLRDELYITDSLNGNIIVLDTQSLNVKAVVHSGKECASMLII